VPAAMAASINCNYGGTGDWIINETDVVVCDGETLVINGNMRIKDNANFTALNTKISFTLAYSLNGYNNAEINLTNTEILDSTQLQENKINCKSFYAKNLTTNTNQRVSIQGTTKTTITDSTFKRDFLIYNHAEANIYNSKLLYPTTSLDLRYTAKAYCDNCLISRLALSRAQGQSTFKDTNITEISISVYNDEMNLTDITPQTFTEKIITSTQGMSINLTNVKLTTGLNTITGETGAKIYINNSKIDTII